MENDGALALASEAFQMPTDVDELGNLVSKVQDWSAFYNGLAVVDTSPFWDRIIEIIEPHLPDRDNPDEPFTDLAAISLRSSAVLLRQFVESFDNDVTEIPESCLKVALLLCAKLVWEVKEKQDVTNISKAVELMIAAEIEGSVHLHGAFLLHLVIKCNSQQLQPKQVLADVSRLWKMRNLLLTLDWTDESISTLKVELCRSLLSTVVMRCHDGHNFLAFIFTLDPSFVMELNDCLKNMVGFVRVSMLKSYSEIIYKAWKQSSGGVRIAIEECLQEWMSCAILCDMNFAKRIRVFLSEFHEKREVQTEQMLYRLYAPILWRHLRVANWKVRWNAAALLSVAFPLVTNTVSYAEQDRMLNLQFDTFMELLHDEHKHVRQVAVKGVSRVLQMYWEIVPSSRAAEMLAKVCSLVKDKTSPHVRCAVANGLNFVLANPLSHGAMKGMISQTADVLCDKNVSVRSAYVSLLDTVSRTKVISYNDITTNAKMLRQLSADFARGRKERCLGQDGKNSCAEVARKLANLLASSIYDFDIKTQVSRAAFVGSSYPIGYLAMIGASNEQAPQHRMRLAAILFDMIMKRANTVMIPPEESSAKSPVKKKAVKDAKKKARIEQQENEDPQESEEVSDEVAPPENPKLLIASLHKSKTISHQLPYCPRYFFNLVNESQGCFGFEINM